MGLIKYVLPILSLGLRLEFQKYSVLKLPSPFSGEGLSCLFVVPASHSYTGGQSGKCPQGQSCHKSYRGTGKESVHSWRHIHKERDCSHLFGKLKAFYPICLMHFLKFILSL